MISSHDTQLQAVLPQLTLPADIRIHAWTETDFSMIQELSDAAGWTTPSRRPADAFAAWQHSWPALVVIHSTEVIGFVRAITDGSVTMYIGELLVAPEWHGKGIGTALLATCQLLFPTTRIDLLSTESADAFYEARGFRPFHGYRKSYL